MSSEYSAIAAKLHAMRAKFLTEKEYEEMFSRKSVNDICAYLKSTPGYGGILGDVNEREIHRGVMELLLEQDMMDEYIRIYSFVDKDKRRLLKFWFMEREAEFLKREIRYIYNNDERSSDEINQGRFEAFFETHTRIDRGIMQNAVSLADCIRACGNTPYAEPLRLAESIGADFFSMGMMIDAYMYSRIWREARKILSGEQIKLFEELIGSKIDMLNLMWIYRGKKYYSFTNEMIFTYLLPVRYRIGGDVIRQLVNSDNADKLAALVSAQTPYGALFEGIGEGRFPEENYRIMYNRIAKRIFINNSGSFAAVFAYLVLKQFEIENITTITEGVRYGLNPEAIRAHVRI